MRIIEIAALENGAHNNQSGGSLASVPEGWAVIPDGMQTPNFPFGDITVEEIGGVPTVTSWTAMPVPVSESDLASAKTAKLAELSAACNAAIVSGCDVTLTDGTTGHIRLTDEDQINLTTAVGAVQRGAAGYPYHLDGELCAVYPAADILIMGNAATAYKLYHTTYCNHLNAWVRRCETAEAVEAITYGATLPEDLAANMAAVLGAMEGGNA